MESGREPFLSLLSRLAICPHRSLGQPHVFTLQMDTESLSTAHSPSGSLRMVWRWRFVPGKKSGHPRCCGGGAIQQFHSRKRRTERERLDTSEYGPERYDNSPSDTSGPSDGSFEPQGRIEFRLGSQRTDLRLSPRRSESRSIRARAKISSRSSGSRSLLRRRAG